MKNLSLFKKIIIINVGIVVLVGVIAGAVYADESFGITLGIICLFGGLLDLFFGLIIIVVGSKIWGKALLLSAAILLLLSGISCGSGLANVNFH